MATIRKRRLVSGEYAWELTHGSGSSRQRFAVGTTREEAEEALRRFERQVALHGGAPSDDSVASIVGQYEAYITANRRASTVARYMRVVKTFHQCFLAIYFPDVQRLRQLRPLHIEEYKTRRAAGEIEDSPTDEERALEHDLRTNVVGHQTVRTAKDRAKFGWLGRHGIRRQVQQQTINYELRALFTFFHWAIKRNHLFINPAALVERFRIPKRALPKFMTPEELKKFFAACDEDERRLFMSILMTGMRKGEIEHLTWADINFELGVIFIQAKPEFDWRPKTDERVVPISPTLRKVLLEQFDKRRSDVLVFPNTAGNVDTDILERLKRICKYAGIRSSTVHALRHSFGAHLRMAGVSLADIGDLLGHKNLATTQIYAKVQQEHLRAAVSKLTPLVGRVSRGELAVRQLPDGKLVSAPKSDSKE
jgi:site-specific recombinase XerD